MSPMMRRRFLYRYAFSALKIVVMLLPLMKDEVTFDYEAGITANGYDF